MKKCHVMAIIALSTLLSLFMLACGLAEEAMRSNEIATNSVSEPVAEVGDVDLFAPEVYTDSDDAADLAVKAVEYSPKASGIAIDSKHFPDIDFRKYVMDYFDANSDGTLSPMECQDVNSIDVDSMGIESVRGIEFFPNLNSLMCGNNVIKELNVKKNPALAYLCCQNNRLSALDISNNPKLELLNTFGNNIAILDIDNCMSLYEIMAYHFVDNGTVLWNGIPDEPAYGFWHDVKTKIVAGSKVLYEPLVVEISEEAFPAKAFRTYVLKNIDTDGDGWLSKKEIKETKTITLRSMNDYFDKKNVISCSNLKGIEYFTDLVGLECVGCKLSSLDISKNKNLDNLTCDYNKLTKLNVSKNKKLQFLQCNYNKLKSLNVQNNTELDCLYFNNNSIKSINLHNNKKLEYFDCSYNKLSQLDLRKNTKLRTVLAINNRIENLKLPKSTKLSYLFCSDNELETLDLRNNTKLQHLWAHGNRIKTIDFSKTRGLQKKLKMKRVKEDGAIKWGKKESWGFNAYLSIDPNTTLTSGTKVLYKGM